MSSLSVAMSKWQRLIWLAPLLAGCASPLSLDKAIATTQTAMLNAQTRAIKQGTVGLYPCETTAEYDVDASGGFGIKSPVSAVAGISTSNAGPTMNLTGTSKVTVKFESVACGAKPEPGQHPMLAPAPHEGD